MPAGGLVTGSLIAGGLIKGGQAIGAGVRQHRINKALRKLGDPQYSATPQLLSYYDKALQESVNPRGLSQESIGAANQGIAAMTTGNIRNAQRLGGGNISSQINAALNTANVDAATRLAERDALMRNQNRLNAISRVGQTTNTLQGIENMNTGLKLEKIRALGKAGSDARMTANYALGDLGNSLISTGAMGLSGAFGEGGGGLFKNAATTTQAPIFTTTTPSFNMFNKPSGFNKYNFGQNQTEQPVFGEQTDPNMLEVPTFGQPTYAPTRRARIVTGFNY